MSDAVKSALSAAGHQPEAAPQVDSGVQANRAPEANQGDEREQMFAKRERQIRQMQKQIQQEKEEMKQRLAQYETDYIPRSKLKEDLWGVLNNEGIDYNRLTEEVLNQPNMNDPTTRALMNKLKALEDKQLAAERSAQEATQRQYEQALAQIKNEVLMTVDAGAEYETIKELGMQEAVVELIEQTFNSEGRLMDIEEAAKQVETYLVEEGLKLAKLKKIQASLAPKTEAEPSVAPKQPLKQSQPQVQLKTLTNTVQAQTSKKSSEKERIARAMAAFKGELK